MTLPFDGSYMKDINHIFSRYRCNDQQKINNPLSTNTRRTIIKRFYKYQSHRRSRSAPLNYQPFKNATNIHHGHQDLQSYHSETDDIFEDKGSYVSAPDIENENKISDVAWRKNPSIDLLEETALIKDKFDYTNSLLLESSIALLSASRAASAAQTNELGTTALVTVEYLKAQLHEFETHYHLGLQRIVRETEERHRQKELSYKKEIHNLRYFVSKLKTSIRHVDQKSSKHRIMDMGFGCCVSTGLLACLFSPHVIFGGLCCLVGGITLSMKQACGLKSSSRRKSSYSPKTTSDTSSNWPSTDSFQYSDFVHTESKLQNYNKEKRKSFEKKLSDKRDHAAPSSTRTIRPPTSLLATAQCKPYSVIFTSNATPCPDSSSVIPCGENIYSTKCFSHIGPTSSWGTSLSNSRCTPDSWITKLRIRHSPYTFNMKGMGSETIKRCGSSNATVVREPPGSDVTQPNRTSDAICRHCSVTSFHSIHPPSSRIRRLHRGPKHVKSNSSQNELRDSTFYSVFHPETTHC